MKLNPIGPLFQRIRNQKQGAEQGSTSTLKQKGGGGTTKTTNTSTATSTSSATTSSTSGSIPINTVATERVDPHAREQIRRARSIIKVTPKESNKVTTDLFGKTEPTDSNIKRVKSDIITSRKSSIVPIKKDPSISGKKCVTIQSLDVEHKTNEDDMLVKLVVNKERTRSMNEVRSPQDRKTRNNEDAGTCTDTSSNETHEGKTENKQAPAATAAAAAPRGLEKQVMYKEFLKRIAGEHAEQNSGRSRSMKQGSNPSSLDHDDILSQSTMDEKNHEPRVSPTDYVLSFLTENAICSPCIKTTGGPSRPSRGSTRASRNNMNQYNKYSISQLLLERIKSADETYYTMDGSRASTSNMRSLNSDDDSHCFSDEETGTSASSDRLSDSGFPNPCVRRHGSGQASV